MKVILKVIGFKLKVSCEPVRKPVLVRGHFRVVNGKRVYVKPYYRKK